MNQGQTDSGTGVTADLPDAELDVLAALTRVEPATAATLRHELEDHRPMAHGSVLTLLKRLEGKGFVRREKGDVGKAFVYRTERDPRPTLRGVVRGLARRVFAGDNVALVATLFEGESPDRAELDRLRLLVDRLERDLPSADEAQEDLR